MVFEFTVTEPQRLDVFLTSQLTEYSRSKIQRLVVDGHATVNDALTLENRAEVQPGDVVRFVEPDPDPDFPPEERRPVPIIFEDDSIIVVDKPVGMITHPNTFQDRGTLVQSLLGSHPEIKEALYDPESAVSRLRPGIVHRLDKDTSGLMVVAKTRQALLSLIEQFQKHDVHKEYETVLYGKLEAPETVSAPIQRKGGETSNMMRASHDPGQGRTAVTHFIPIETYVPYAKWPKEVVTKVRAQIETGRTHQIRVHAKFIGHPVMGDKLYGNNPSEKLSEKLELTTQQLRSVTLSFTHPKTGKPVTFTVS